MEETERLMIRKEFQSLVSLLKKKWARARRTGLGLFTSIGPSQFHLSLITPHICLCISHFSPMSLTPPKMYHMFPVDSTHT